jgi:hypothetical protein
MKNTTKILVSATLLVALTLASCKFLGLRAAATVFTDDVSGAVSNVVLVHDGYASELQEPDNINFMADSDAWLTLVTGNDTLTVLEFNELGELVMDRHDAMVEMDTALDVLARRVYLRNTSLLRDYVEAAKANQ